MNKKRRKQVSVALKTEEEGDKVVRGNDYDVGGVAAQRKTAREMPDKAGGLV